MVPCCGARTWPLIQEDVNLTAPTDSGNTDLSDLGEEDLANLAKDEQVTKQQIKKKYIYIYSF